MTNRVPPLHPASPPPFHPDSPPPFGKTASYDDDVDEIDDFGEYIAGTPNLEEEYQRNSSETLVSVNVAAVISNGPSINSEVETQSIDEVVVCVCDENSSFPTETQNGTSAVHDVKPLEEPIEAPSINLKKIAADDKFTNHCVDSLVDNIVEKNVNRDGGYNVEISNASSFFEIKEQTSLKTFDTGELAAESSDDSSADINEAAFIVSDYKSDNEEENIPEDNVSNVSSSINGDCEKGANIDIPKLSAARELDFPNAETNFKIDQLSLSSPIPIDTINTETVSIPSTVEFSGYETVTIDYPEVVRANDAVESSLALENIDEFPSENDDFDDFVSPPIHGVQSLKQSTNENESKVLDVDELNTSNADTYNCNLTDVEFWSDIFEHKGEDPIEVNLNTLEGKLNGSSVWCKLKNIEATSALNFNWNDSATKKLLLITLGIDSRNILFGPRWNSEVPRFASNLGLSPLVPQKAAASENNDSQQSYTFIEEPVPENRCEENNFQIRAGIQDAHFDWTGSGLTNPLGARKSDKITKVSTNNELEYNNPTISENASASSELSTEASKILESLPDLLVMEKQYIVFPIR